MIKRILCQDVDADASLVGQTQEQVSCHFHCDEFSPLSSRSVVKTLKRRGRSP